MKNNYKQKYLKYKMKYLNLKQNGGARKSCPNVEIFKLIAEGSFGDVYSIKGYDNVVAKVIKIGNQTNVNLRTMTSDHFNKEVKYAELAFINNIGPEIFCNAIINRNGNIYGIIYQQKLHQTALSFLHMLKNMKSISQSDYNNLPNVNTKIQELFQKMVNKNIYNADISLKNIMFNSDYSKAYMIDFSETIGNNDLAINNFNRVKKEWERSFNWMYKQLQKKILN